VEIPHDAERIQAIAARARQELEAALRRDPLIDELIRSDQRDGLDTALDAFANDVLPPLGMAAAYERHFRQVRTAGAAGARTLAGELTKDRVARAAAIRAINVALRRMEE
jgi:hypothetical protein